MAIFTLAKCVSAFFMSNGVLSPSRDAQRLNDEVTIENMETQNVKSVQVR